TSITRWRDGPYDLGLLRPRIAVSMRTGALEAETVARLQHRALPIDPKLEAAAYDHPGLLARVRVGLFAGRSAWRQAAQHQLELSLERRAEQLVDDSRREGDAPPPRAANYQAMLVRADGIRLEKPANGDPQGVRDRQQ